MEVKVLSWNIWIDGFCDGWDNFLSTANADVVGLQEVKDDDPERNIIEVLKEKGYQYTFAHTEQVWNGKTYRHGPAIFSKFPIIHSEKIQLEKGSDERAAAYAQIDVEGTTLHVFSVHTVHTHQKESAQQITQIKKLIAKLPEKRVIVMGDFNATPESATIQIMKDTLVDTDASSSPTWSRYPEGCGICDPQEIDTKLDYIFVSPELNAHAFVVGHSDASDHLPISVSVKI